jgi:hypothetical protein
VRRICSVGGGSSSSSRHEWTTSEICQRLQCVNGCPLPNVLDADPTETWRRRRLGPWGSESCARGCGCWRAMRSFRYHRISPTTPMSVPTDTSQQRALSRIWPLPDRLNLTLTTRCLFLPPTNSAHMKLSRPRERRHGRGVQGARSLSRPHRRHQAPAQRAGPVCQRRAIPVGSPRHRRIEPSQLSASCMTSAPTTSSWSTSKASRFLACSLPPRSSGSPSKSPAPRRSARLRYPASRPEACQHSAHRQELHQAARLRSRQTHNRF